MEKTNREKKKSRQSEICIFSSQVSKHKDDTQMLSCFRSRFLLSWDIRHSWIWVKTRKKEIELRHTHEATQGNVIHLFIPLSLSILLFLAFFFSLLGRDFLLYVTHWASAHKNLRNRSLSNLLCISWIKCFFPTEKIYWQYILCIAKNTRGKSRKMNVSLASFTWSEFCLISFICYVCL